MKLKQDEMLPKDSDEMKVAFKLACKQAETYLQSGIAEDENTHARMVMGVLGNYSRLRAVETHEAGLRMVAARVMANNTDELRAQLQKSLPEYVIKK